MAKQEKYARLCKEKMVDEIVGRSFDIFHKRPEHQRNIVADPKNMPHRAKFPLGDEWLDLTAWPGAARSIVFSNTTSCTTIPMTGLTSVRAAAAAIIL